MEPKFQTSFIPKSPISSQSKAPSVSIPTVNVFSSVATVMFVLTIILLGSLFGYEFYLKKQIEKADSEIIAAKQAYQLDTVQNIIDVNSRIKSTKSLLDKHVAISELFSLLQTLTLKKISFSNFIYTDKDNVYSIEMETEAQTYNALANQYSVFSESSFIKNPQFSNFSLSENGNIKTKFTATIDPTLVSFKKAVEANSSNI